MKLTSLIQISKLHVSRGKFMLCRRKYLILYLDSRVAMGMLSGFSTSALPSPTSVILGISRLIVNGSYWYSCIALAPVSDIVKQSSRAPRALVFVGKNCASCLWS